MDAPRSFHGFGKLPLELRVDIWRHALSGTMVIAYAAATGFRPIGPTTWAVGLACREARRVFGQTHHEIRLGGGGMDAAWISEHTVLRLPNQHECLAGFARLDAARRRRVLHVAVCYEDGGAPWTKAYDQTVMRCLSASCPSLRTFILQTARPELRPSELDEDRELYRAYRACLAEEDPAAAGASSMFTFERDEILAGAERYFAGSGVRAHHVAKILASRAGHDAAGR